MPAIPGLSSSESASSLASPRRITDALRHVTSRGSSLTARQNSQTAGIIPAQYEGLDSGPAPGTVVGIVLGSVAGFLFLIWLFYALAATGGTNAIAGEEEVVVRRRDRSPRSRRSRRSREIREVREVSRPREHIIVDERRERVRSQPPRRSRSLVREEVVERRVEGDDIVEVIEEPSDFSPPRRKRSHRNSGHYRYDDPDRYAGGNYPKHYVERLP